MHKPMHNGTVVEELRQRGLVAVLELRTAGDSDLSQLLRPHKIRQIEAIIVALDRCAADTALDAESRAPALQAIGEIRGALAVCLKRLEWTSVEATDLLNRECA